MKHNTMPISIQRWLYYIIAVLSCIMLLFQLLFQSYFVDYVGRIYSSNMDVVMDRIASEVQTTFASMNNAVEYIADNPDVQDYAKTTSTDIRYRKAFSLIRPIVQVATQNLGFDHILISDVTGAWYRFEGVLSGTSGQLIKSSFSGTWGISNTVMTLDDVAYFCTAKPIFSIEESAPQQVGLVVALVSVSKTRSLLEDYGRSHNLSILLHDFDKVLVSNIHEMEYLPLSDVPYGQDELERSETIMPGALGVVIRVAASNIFPKRTTLVFSLLCVGAVSLLLFLGLAIILNRLIIRPFSHVIAETDALGSGDLSRRLRATNVSHVDELVEGINHMLDRLEEYSRRVFVTQQNLYEMELDRKETQMYLLRNQIDRHFLYNSLISIRSLADRRENEKVEEVAGGIAQLLRYATSHVKEVNLFDEMEIIMRYIRIQNIRFDDRIALETDVDDELCNYKTLRLLIQPLVENALIHGLEKKRVDGTLHIRGNLCGEVIRIEVEDNGAGISAEHLAQLQYNISNVDQIDIQSEIEGIALVNVQKRILLAYGDSFGLSVDSKEGEYTCSVLLLPAIFDDTLSEQEGAPTNEC